MSWDEDEQERVLRALSGRRPNARGWVRADCPFCADETGKPDRKQCLGVSARGFGRCFRCGASGWLDEELIPDALRAVTVERALLDEQQPMELPEGFLCLYEEPALSSMACRAPRAYLEKERGLSALVLRDAGVGVTFTDAKAHNRIVIPIWSPGGDLLGWSARPWCGAPTRKYLYPSGMRRTDVIYNHAALHVQTDTPIAIVEGCFDALALWPDGAALLGSTTREQVEALLSARRPVAIVFDGDAWEKARQLAARLRFEGVVAGDVRLDPGLDPDDVPRAWLEERMRRACEIGSA